MCKKLADTDIHIFEENMSKVAVLHVSVVISTGLCN